MGVEAARRTLASRPTEHTGLLQHQALHAEDAGRTPRAVVLAHHEALEEDELADRQAGSQRLSALLLSGTVKYVPATEC